MTETAEIRVASDCAEAMGLTNLSTINVNTGKSAISGRIRISPELPSGVAVLPEGTYQARSLMPCKVERKTGSIVSGPVSLQAEWLR
jgi:hypothetical protein